MFMHHKFSIFYFLISIIYHSRYHPPPHQVVEGVGPHRQVVEVVGPHQVVEVVGVAEQPKIPLKTMNMFGINMKISV